MIGVAVQPSERAAAGEFFELCKTAWEFFDPARQYEIVISTSGFEAQGAALIILFSSEARAGFAPGEFPTAQHRSTGTMLEHGGRRLPIYGSLSTFPGNGLDLIRDATTGDSVLFASRRDTQTIAWVGYDLFAEVQHLLTLGQPIDNALFPTLDYHIALVRDLVTRAGLPFLEIPPVPAGYRFTCCLTHDIDHPLLRNHRWDHTMFGFIFRSLIMSPINVCRGRISMNGLLRNWAAVVRLPFVHLGMAADPWSGFDQYVQVEAGLGSTYFFIAERDNPGGRRDGQVAGKRACRYSLSEVASQLKSIITAGKEIALHGLDAWMDADSASQEKRQLSQATGESVVGTRMHWLYFDQDSHVALEQAGFSYDSTVGYNEAVGYRAGTSQIYRPLRNETLLELPLHIMDTALFYPSYLNLGEREAFRLVASMLDQVERFGGVLTLNWHDRSIFPERLWDGFYRRLLDEMKRRQAWFPTAAQAVAWFRKRRAASIETVRLPGERLTRESGSAEYDSLPGLTLRTHHPCPRLLNEALATGSPAPYSDTPFIPMRIQNEPNSSSWSAS